MQSPPSPPKEIDIKALKGIHFFFPGDVYILAGWLVMADRSKSTPLRKAHTTLFGLANIFISLYDPAGSCPLSAEEMMRLFAGHGISGNPSLIMEQDNTEDFSQLALDGSEPSLLSAVSSVTASDSHGESQLPQPPMPGV